MSRFSILGLVCFAATACVVPSQAALLTLDNGTVKVGADTALGGSITYLSQSGSTTNLINSHDYGRQVQQSYYSGPSDFHPAGTTQNASWSPWPWNPIGTGDSYGTRATVLASSNTGGVIYIKSTPMQWALKNVPGDCTFEWWIRLEGAAVRVHCRLTNQRTDTTQYGARNQELPAVYGVGTLNRLFSYTGAAPFTSAALTTLPAVGPPWTQWRATENWSAMVNSADFGIGVHHPDAIYTTGGYYSTGSPGTGGPTSANTGYLAPIHAEMLDANLVYEYDFNLILGTLTNIRSWVYAHANDHRPAWRFSTDRSHWAANLGDAGPPAGFIRQKLGTDPQLNGPYTAFPSASVPTIYFSARYNVASPPTGPMANLFWETNNAGGFATGNSLSIPVTIPGGWRIYSIPVGTSVKWTGLISDLRLDAIQSGGTGDTVDIGGISWKNDPPAVSALADVAAAVGTAPAPVNFTVTDDLIPDDALTVTASSSNQTLLPNSGLQVRGIGPNRTISVAPVANQLGTATVTVNTSDGTVSATNTFALTVTGTAMETWRFAKFGTTANSGTAADTANPDGDPWTNAQEYILGTNPTVANTSTSLSVTPSGQDFALTFTAIQAAGAGYAGLTRYYDVETTTDLANSASWTALSGSTNIIGADQTVTITQPRAVVQKFFRLKVRLQ